jgi:hypothetical protein
MQTSGHVVFAGLMVALAVPVQAATHTVNCHAGQTIAKALTAAIPGDTVRVRGTGEETVRITQDDILLDGRGTAVLDGQGASQAVLTIDGARRVTIKGLTVRKGFRGLLVRSGAAVRLHGVTAVENTEDGIHLDEGATARLIAPPDGATPLARRLLRRRVTGVMLPLCSHSASGIHRAPRRKNHARSRRTGPVRRRARNTKPDAHHDHAL